MTTSELKIDLRLLEHDLRRPLVFDTLRKLASGGSFVVVIDHDPMMLKGKLQAEFSDQFTWQYLQNGPDVWQVRLGKK